MYSISFGVQMALARAQRRQYLNCRATYVVRNKYEEEIRRSGADYTHQRSLHFILIHFPTTAGSAQFCLLCCQPEPIPGTLAARKHLLTQRVPCRLPVWSRMNHLHEVQDMASSPTLHRQVHMAQVETRKNATKTRTGPS